MVVVVVVVVAEVKKELTGQGEINVAKMVVDSGDPSSA